MVILFRLSVTTAIFIAIGFTCHAQDKAKLLFEDDFQRSESQEDKEELGGEWRTNSNNRAHGNKQADLRDGALFIYRHASADHGVSVVHAANYRDCRIHLRFRLDDKRDDLGIDFADMQCKEVHAGHICKIFFRPGEIEMFDFKNGRMNKAYRDAAKANKATEEQKAGLAKWQRGFKAPIRLTEWHSAIVTIAGDTMSVELDGEPIGAFSSPGMAHEKKDMVRFSARKNAYLDDVRMFSLSPTAQSSVSSVQTPVRHLFGAKLLLRKMEAVGITAEQKAEFDRLSADLRTRVDNMRTAAGITPELIKKRDAVYSELKGKDLSSDEIWNTLQQRINLTDAQRDTFRETKRQNKEFRAKALQLLTKDQRANLTKKSSSKDAPSRNK